MFSFVLSWGINCTAWREHVQLLGYTNLVLPVRCGHGLGGRGRGTLDFPGTWKREGSFSLFSLALLLFFRGPDRSERVGEAQNGKPHLAWSLRSLSALALLFGSLFSLTSFEPSPHFGSGRPDGHNQPHWLWWLTCFVRLTLRLSMAATWPGCHFQLTFQSDWWHYFGQPYGGFILANRHWRLRGASTRVDNVWLNVMLSLIQLLVEVVEPWSTHGQICPGTSYRRNITNGHSS